MSVFRYSHGNCQLMTAWCHGRAVPLTKRARLSDFLSSGGLKGGVESRSMTWKVISGSTDLSREARWGREGTRERGCVTPVSPAGKLHRVTLQDMHLRVTAPKGRGSWVHPVQAALQEGCLTSETDATDADDKGQGMQGHPERGRRGQLWATKSCLNMGQYSACRDCLRKTKTHFTICAKPQNLRGEGRLRTRLKGAAPSPPPAPGQGEVPGLRGALTARVHRLEGERTRGQHSRRQTRRHCQKPVM